MDELKILSVAHRFGQWEIACLYNDDSRFQFKVDYLEHPSIDNTNRRKLTHLIAQDVKVRGVGKTLQIYGGNILETGEDWKLPEGVDETLGLIDYAVAKYGIEVNEMPKTVVQSVSPMMSPMISTEVNTGKYIEQTPIASVKSN